MCGCASRVVRSSMGTRMKLPRSKFLHLAAGAAALPAASRVAGAQAYPSLPVRIIVRESAISSACRCLTSTPQRNVRLRTSYCAPQDRK
jgi:hypothetical protein